MRHRITAPTADRDGRLRDVLGGLSGVAVQLDRAGAVTFVNDAFLDLTGWARGEVLGAEWGDDLVPAGCASRAMFAAAAGAGVPARAEGEVFTRDGGRRVVAWDVVAVRDDHGGPAGAVAVGRDVTDERRGAGERARMVQALAAMTDRDEPTGLLNAQGFARIAEHAGRVAARLRRTDALIWVAVDAIGALYAAHGDAAADDAVCAVAEALRGVVRDSDVIARVADDVFVVYAVGTATPGHGDSAAVRVRAALVEQNARARAAGRAFGVGCRVSVAEREAGDDVDTLLRRAAEAPALAVPAGAEWEAPEPWERDPWDTAWDARPFDS